MITWSYTIKDTGKRIFSSSRYSKHILFFHNSFSSSRTSLIKMITKPENPRNSYIVLYVTAPKTVQKQGIDETFLCEVAREPQILLGTTTSISTILIRFLLAKKIDFMKFSFFITFSDVFCIDLGLKSGSDHENINGPQTKSSKKGDEK